MAKRAVWGPVVALAIVLLLGILTQFYLPSYIEGALEAGVEGAVQQAGIVDARVEARPAVGMLLGRFGSLDLEARRLRFNGLDVEGFMVSARNLVIDPWQLVTTKKLVVRSADSLQVTISLTEDALNRYFWERVDPRRQFEIRLTRDERVHLSGALRLLGFEFDLTVSGRFEVRDKTKVAFVPESFAVERTTVPQFVLDAVTREWALLLDFSNLPVPLEIRSVRLEEGRLFVYGEYTS